MIESEIWKKLNYLIGILLIGAVVGVAGFWSTIEVKDLDLWLHLAVGKFITQNGYVPSVDILSAVIAGKPWDNHEWLFQVLIYNIFNQFGFDGLLRMQSVIVILTLILLLFISYNKEKQMLIAVSMCLVVLVFQHRFTLRPDIFSLLYFSIYIYVLSVHIDKKWAAIVLFITQILWVNMHGFFFFGPVFILIGIFAEWIKRNIKLPYAWNKSGRLTNEEFRRLGEIFILVVLACFLNPGLAKGAWYPIGMFFNLSGDHKVFFEHIQELERPIASLRDLFNFDNFAPYKLLIMLSGLSFVLNRRNIDVSALLFWFVFLIFSIKANRNTPYFAFAAYLVILNNFYNLGMRQLLPIRFIAKKFQYLTELFLKFLFLMWVINFAQGVFISGYYDFDKYERKSEFGGVSLRSFPTKAVDFLVDNKIKGNFFNDFNSGAYLIGRTFPNIKVFIDGRTEAYGPDFFNKYRRIINKGDGDLFEAAVKRYNLTGILISSTTGVIPHRFFKYIYNNPDWVIVYFNYDGVVFLKKVEQNQQWIDRFAIDLKNWTPPETDLYRMGPTFVAPYQYYYRAFSLESIDVDEPALKEAQAALKIDPTYSPAFEILGKIYAKQNKFEEAFGYFRFAAMLSSSNKENRHNLAMAYTDLGKFDLAIKQYEAMRERWPDDARVYLFMAKVYARDGKLDLSFEALEKGYKQNAAIAREANVIADIFVHQKDVKNMKRVYDRALELQPKEVDLYIKYAESYSKLDNKPLAREILQKGLSVLPDNEEIKKQLKLLDDKV